MKEIPKKIKNYLKETRAEVRKVAWPDQQYVMTATTVIIAISILIGLFVSVMDLAFAQLIMTLNQVF